jgi:hypothetical protein
VGVVTFIETKLFTKLVQNYFTDEEYAALQSAIMANPDAGMSSLDLVAFGNCGGAWPGAASGVGFASSTICDCSRAKCGC